MKKRKVKPRNKFSHIYVCLALESVLGSILEFIGAVLGAL